MFEYCEINFIRGVPIFVIFVGRLIREIKNPTNSETCEAVWHRYLVMLSEWPRLSEPAAQGTVNNFNEEMFICENIQTTSRKTKITSKPYTNGDTLLSAV